MLDIEETNHYLSFSLSSDIPPMDSKSSSLLWNTICPDVFKYTMSFAAMTDVANVLAVCVSWQTAGRSDQVWRGLYESRWGLNSSALPCVTVRGEGKSTPYWLRCAARLRIDKNWRSGNSSLHFLDFTCDESVALWGHNIVMSCALWGHDRVVWTDALDGDVHIQKVGSKQVELLKGHDAALYCMKIKGDRMVTGSKDKTVRLWDLNTSECLRVMTQTVYEEEENGVCLREIKQKQDGRFDTGGIFCLDFDEHSIVSGGENACVCVWDADANGRQSVQLLRGHTRRVIGVVLTAAQIISCSQDGAIRVWCRESGSCKQLLCHLPKPRFRVDHDVLVWAGDVLCVAHDPENENRFFSGGADGLMRVWEFTASKGKWECVREIKAFGGGLCGGAVLSMAVNGKRLVMIGEGRQGFEKCILPSLKIWDIEGLLCQHDIAYYETHIGTVYDILNTGLSIDTTRLAYRMNGKLHVYDYAWDTASVDPSSQRVSKSM